MNRVIEMVCALHIILSSYASLITIVGVAVSAFSYDAVVIVNGLLL